MAEGNSRELLAGGVYGCALFQDFVRDQYWHLSRAESLQLVLSLVAAFGESNYASRPQLALLFGRNGAFGAGIGATEGAYVDCGSSVFQAISTGKIIVRDPYDTGTPSTPRPGMPDGPGIEDWDR